MDKKSYMTPDQLTEWQDHMGYSSPEAAEALDLHINTYLNYRRGYRTMSSKINSDVAVPRSVSVDCAAIVMGVDLYTYDDINLKDYPR